MKEETLKKRGQLKQTFKKTILIPGLTCLIIAAQSVPMFGTVSNDALARFADSMSYTITAEAATEAKNQKELAERYGLDTNSTSPDHKYVRTSKEGSNGVYYATIEGYEGSHDTLQALKSYLGISSFNPDKYSNLTSDTCSNTIKKNQAGLGSKLGSKSSRKQLAKIGAETTDWINASWDEAADLTVLHAFGVVNDDFGLIKYDSGNRNKTCSRGDFYTMVFRFRTYNNEDDDIERMFKDDKNAVKEYEKALGKNNKQRNAIAAVYNNINYAYTGSFFDGAVNKKNMAQGITKGEVLCLLSNMTLEDGGVSLASMKKKLDKKFKDISMSSFNNEDLGDVYKGEIGDYEAIQLYKAMKAGILKPDAKGNANFKSTLTYREAVKLMTEAARKLGKL